MPAIHRRHGPVLRTDNRPDTSRHIGCLPNRQPPQPPLRGSRHALQDADADNAARMEAADSNILKDCPCSCKPVGGERDFIGKDSVRSDLHHASPGPLALPPPRSNLAAAIMAKT